MDEEELLAEAPKQSPIIKILAVVIAFFLIGFFVYSLFPKESPQQALPQVTAVPSQTLYVTPSPTPIDTSLWEVITNNDYHFQISKPPGWTKANRSPDQGRIFEQGDILELTIVGSTQRQNTELHDGGQFVIAIPTKTDERLDEWLHKKYRVENELSGEKYIYSSETIGLYTFQKVFGCGLSCYTFYYIRRNEFIYEISMYAGGPHKDLHEESLRGILSTFEFTGQSNSEIISCGGIAGTTCPEGYMCKYDGDYPDAGGTCLLTQ